MYIYPSRSCLQIFLVIALSIGSVQYLTSCDQSILKSPWSWKRSICVTRAIGAKPCSKSIHAEAPVNDYEFSITVKTALIAAIPMSDFWPNFRF